MNNNCNLLKNRFRKFYPVIIDIETAGLNHNIHAILEISVITLTMNYYGNLKIKNTLHLHIQPFPSSNLQTKSLMLNKINPFSIIRQPITEYQAIKYINDIVTQEIKYHECTTSVIVAHNATFDHNCIIKLSNRYNITHPFHPFVTFDTATLSGLLLGQTVLSKACQAIGIRFNNKKAHSAIYDAQKTAFLFCKLVNYFKISKFKKK